MPRAASRHSIDIPTYLWEAINQIAEEEDIATSALVTLWLWQKLEEKRPDLHVRQPFRDGREPYSRGRGKEARHA